MPFEDYEREIRASAADACSAPADSTPRATSSPSPSTAGRTATRATISTSRTWPGTCEPLREVVGRQRFGRIAIANSDAGADAYTHAAIDQAWRAINDLGNAT